MRAKKNRMIDIYFNIYDLHVYFNLIYKRINLFNCPLIDIEIVSIHEV